jgi:transcriptional regulator of acetoin/glycerol metabolism
VLLSGEEERFQEEHLERVRLLKEPLVIAMSNALKHREVLRYNALLADDNRFPHGELRRVSGEDIVGAHFGHPGAVIPEGVVNVAGAEEEMETLDTVVSRHIQRMLAWTRGKVNGPHGAAALLGVNPSTLRNRMRKLGIPFGRKLRPKDRLSP